MVDGFLKAASQYGVYIAGIAALISYLFEIYSGLRRTGPATAWTNAKMVFRLLVTIIAVTTALIFIGAQYERKSPAALAAEDIIWTYHSCLDAAATLDKATFAAIERSKRPVRLQCLAYAVDRKAPAGAANAISAKFAEDIELGQKLVADPADKDPIADAFYDYFGIKKDTFLGTGYSVPRSRENETDQYNDAQVREHLLLNVCAEKMPAAGCAERDYRMWAWAMRPERMNHLTVGQLIGLVPPRDGAPALRNAWRAHAREPAAGPWLIRFSKFPIDRYKGTIGRPQAVYVFFSELDQTLDMRLGDAWRLSGATTKELDVQDPKATFFVWVAAPPENGDYTKLATWQSVIQILKGMQADPVIVNAAKARREPLLHRLQHWSAS